MQDWRPAGGQKGASQACGAGAVTAGPRTGGKRARPQSPRAEQGVQLGQWAPAGRRWPLGTCYCGAQGPVPSWSGEGMSTPGVKHTPYREDQQTQQGAREGVRLPPYAGLPWGGGRTWPLRREPSASAQDAGSWRSWLRATWEAALMVRRAQLRPSGWQEGFLKPGADTQQLLACVLRSKVHNF